MAVKKIVAGTPAEKQAPPPVDPLVGKEVGHGAPMRYSIVKPIGVGSRGTTYLGEHIRVKRRVILKRLDIDPRRADLSDRFLRRAGAIGAIEHSNATLLLDFFKDDKGHFLVFEYAQGFSLARKILEGEFTLAFVVHVIGKLCAALTEGHDRGLIHGNIKAANVLIRERADGEQIVKLLDFGVAHLLFDRYKPGLAKYMKEEDAGLEDLIGSPEYFAPEIIQGMPPTPQTDVYSLGVLMYLMLTGSYPFPLDPSSGDIQEQVGALYYQVTGPAPAPSVLKRNPQVHRKIAAVVMQAIAKDPKKRWQTAAQLRFALNELATEILGRLPTMIPIHPSPEQVSGPRQIGIKKKQAEVSSEATTMRKQETAASEHETHLYGAGAESAVRLPPLGIGDASGTAPEGRRVGGAKESGLMPAPPRPGPTGAKEYSWQRRRSWVSTVKYPLLVMLFLLLIWKYGGDWWKYYQAREAGIRDPDEAPAGQVSSAPTASASVPPAPSAAPSGRSVFSWPTPTEKKIPKSPEAARTACQTNPKANREDCAVYCGVCKKSAKEVAKPLCVLACKMAAKPSLPR